MMNEFFQYGAVFLWGILAVLTFFIGKKHGAGGYLLSVFFVFMAVWYGLRAFGGLPVFDGVAGFVFRGLLIGFLLIILALWWKSRKARTKNDTEDSAE